MGLQVDVLDALGDVGRLVDRRGLGEAGVRVALAVVQLGDDVPFGDGVLGVQHRRSRQHRRFRVGDRRQEPVLDPDGAAGPCGERLAVGHDRGDALAGEAHEPVQDDAVGRIVADLLVQAGRVER